MSGYQADHHLTDHPHFCAGELLVKIIVNTPVMWHLNSLPNFLYENRRQALFFFPTSWLKTSDFAKLLLFSYKHSSLKQVYQFYSYHTKQRLSTLPLHHPLNTPEKDSIVVEEDFNPQSYKGNRQKEPDSRLFSLFFFSARRADKICVRISSTPFGVFGKNGLIAFRSKGIQGIQILVGQEDGL